MQTTREERELLQRALLPLARIADAYDRNELDDEARRYWGEDNERENDRPASTIELYSGRGGRRLLTLQDCFNARGVLNFIYA